MKKDVSIFWYLIPIVIMMIGSSITEGLLRGVLVGGGLFAIGAVCLINFKRCGRVHCAVTGPLFIGLGILTLLVHLEIVVLHDAVLNALLVGGLILGFGVEYRYRRKHGTCYVRRQRI